MQGARHGARSGQPRAVPDPRRGRARHLVLLGAVAVLDARLAGRDAGAQALLPDRRAGHRLRHHLLLGRPDDDDGPALHEGGAVPRRLHPRPRPRREGRQDVEVEGQRHRSARADRRVRRRCAALHAGGHGGAGPRHQARHRSASRATATSRPSSGTPPLRRDERLRARRRASIPKSAQGDAQPLDRARDRARPRARSPRRSRPTGSTTRRARPIASSGTSSATGISNWPSRCCTGADGAGQGRDAARWPPGCSTRSCKLLHPFMPFITEELWAVTAEGGPARDGLLALAALAGSSTALDDAEAEAEIGWLVDLVTAIRSVRAEMNIPPATQIPLVLVGASAATRARAERWADFMQAAGAPVRHFASPTRAPQGSVQLVVRGEVAALPLEGVIDLAAETRAPREGNGARSTPTSRASTPSSAMPTSSPARRRRWSKASARSAKRPRRAAPRSSKRWSGSKARREETSSLPGIAARVKSAFTRVFRRAMPAHRARWTEREQRTPQPGAAMREFWVAAGLLWLAGVASAADHSGGAAGHFAHSGRSAPVRHRGRHPLRPADRPVRRSRRCRDRS